MAFCPNCGAQVSGRFCPNCGTDTGVSTGAGTAAPGATGSVPPNAGFTSNSGFVPPSAAAPGLSNNLASALCYLLWIVTGVIFLVLSPYNRDRTVRFHAYQSIFATIAMIVVDIVIAIFGGVLGSLHMWPLIGAMWFLFRLLVFLAWLYLMYMAYNNRKVVIPLIGPLAEKQA